MSLSLLLKIAFVGVLPCAFSLPADSPAKPQGWEYIVVGSGAGGGPLAARLALAGKRTLLIEAGDDQGANINYQVPTFHAYSTEDPSMAWDFYVKHYDDPARQVLDSKMAWVTPSGQKYVGLSPPQGSQQLGILYPRAGTIGGCTSHNALVSIYPHEQDWNHIANVTGDTTWAASNMRRFYQRIENVDYNVLGSPGHGFDGSLHVSRTDILLGYNDTKLQGLGLSSASQMGARSDGLFATATNLGRILNGDVNSGDANRDQREGVFNIPLAINGRKRNGAREFLTAVLAAKKYPLDIMTNTLVTKVRFVKDPGSSVPRAVGVDYLRGKSLYKADPRWQSANKGEVGSAMASAEVILAGGAFNTPQLLKLSGIGPAAELQQFNIPTLVDLPGVGTNLQDHFEIGVTHQAKDAFAVIANCKYNKVQPDTCLENWKDGNGPYASSNGFIFALIKKSTVAAQDTIYGNDPDLLLFGGIADFRGYYPGYSNDVYGHTNWTWVVLKAHTGNYGPKAGTVKLRSADPQDVPDINFRYFDNGRNDNNAAARDLQAMSEAIALARAVTSNATTPLADGPVYSETRPGAAIKDNDQVKQHIQNEAWSHHASCTCPIGATNDPWAVLDSKFRVRGTQGLRVADASVFPRIPGFFIAIPTYMIGEKAAEAILKEG